jgi:hypothetical protein
MDFKKIYKKLETFLNANYHIISENETYQTHIDYDLPPIDVDNDIKSWMLEMYYPNEESPLTPRWIEKENNPDDFDKIYPVGTIYYNINPDFQINEVIGFGHWEQLTDKTVNINIPDKNLNFIGGANDYKLDSSNIPSHTHDNTKQTGTTTDNSDGTLAESHNHQAWVSGHVFCHCTEHYNQYFHLMAPRKWGNCAGPVGQIMSQGSHNHIYPSHNHTASSSNDNYGVSDPTPISLLPKSVNVKCWRRVS